MISFEIQNISVSFFKVTLSLKVNNEIDMKELNKKLQFYFMTGSTIEELDSTFFYTQRLPNVPAYTDRLLENNEIIKIDYSNASLLSGVTGKVVALNLYSSSFVWSSPEITLKTKPIETPLVVVSNIYDDGLISTINFSYLVDEQDRILDKFFVQQQVFYEGNTKSIIAISPIGHITGPTMTRHHYDLAKYGSYYIKTNVLNHNSQLVYTHISRYVKIPELLPMAYKQAWDPNTDINQGISFNPTNYKSKKILNVLYKKDGVVYRIVDYRVKL